MSSTDFTGRFLWYELMTTDPAAAQAFYTKVLGWGTSTYSFGQEAAVGSSASDAMPPYTMWMRGETPVGGVMALPDAAKQAGAPPHWLGYIGATDVDATAAKAAGLGAKVLVAPQDIPSVGRFAVLADPQGATFAIYAPGNAPGPEAQPELGDVSWHELTTTDHGAAFAFYQELFGWEKKEAMDMGPMGIYQMFGSPTRMLGGMMNRTPDMPAPPNWLYYTRVDDLPHTVEQVTALGGKVLHGPMDVPGGDTVAVCMDPQGAAFAVHQVKKG